VALEEMVLLLLLQEFLQHMPEVEAAVFNQDLQEHQAEPEAVVMVELVKLDPVDKEQQDALTPVAVGAVEDIQELVQ
tara:strand:+ start:505 stop:735 length:231 start_codon:yes stop_codon:yes gene_type:complete